MLVRAHLLRRLCGAALLLPLLALALSFAHDLTICRYTGAIVAPCACPGDASATPARVAGDDCCDRQEIAPMPSARAASDAAVLAAPPLFATLAPLGAARPPAVARPLVAPRAVGPPILLRKSALLL